MWEKRIGAAGAIVAGGVVFIVLAIFLDRVSDQAAQWMQAGGTVLAFAGLLYVHWNEGRRERKALLDASALAVAAVGKEMVDLAGIVEKFLERNRLSTDSEFFRSFRINPAMLEHPHTDRFVDRLAVEHVEAARLAIDAMDAARAAKHVAKACKGFPTEAGRKACTSFLDSVVLRAKQAADLLGADQSGPQAVPF